LTRRPATSNTVTLTVLRRGASRWKLVGDVPLRLVAGLT
jgi:hypothetical protein